MLVIGDNFSYGGAKPLDARLNYNTLAQMKAVADSTMYNGCMAYCTGTDKTYQWKSTNTVDETTGKWREFNSGGGGGTEYTAGDGIDITNDVISTKQSEEGDIDEIIDVYPTAGNLVSIVNAFNRGDLYSTDEKMIGQYIDGKPLYQKTISCGTLPNNTTKVISIGTNIDTIVDVKGIASRNGAMLTIPRCYTDSTFNIDVSVSTTSGELSLVTAFDYSSYNAYVTIQYTKVSDTAISIGEATEYSTEEKIVGTWIDGRPIWQKTIQNCSLGNNTTIGTPHGISDIDNIISVLGFTKDASGNTTSIPYAPVNNISWGIQVFVNATNINLTTGQDWSGKQGTITVQYTKTTT